MRADCNLEEREHHHCQVHNTHAKNNQKSPSSKDFRKGMRFFRFLFVLVVLSWGRGGAGGGGGGKGFEIESSQICFICCLIKISVLLDMLCVLNSKTLQHQRKISLGQTVFTTGHQNTITKQLNEKHWTPKTT